MTHQRRVLVDDTILILTMALLAGCGLIYEYLLSHYAGRVLGVMESTIYTMIGLMIVAMGFGAFAARKIKCPFNGFVWLEVIIALLGCSAILLIGGAIAITQLLPQLVADTFNMPPDALPRGGIFKSLSWFALKLPYVFGALLGFFIGMEIPLIAKIREHIHQKHLQHNLGTIYGADYIGAGVGAAIWVLFLLAIDISKAGAITAGLNLVAGGVFISRFWAHLKWRKVLVSLHVVLAILMLIIFQQGNNWLNQMNNLLYLDKVIYSDKTRYQQLTFTERNMGVENESVINFYLNGRLQFSSLDEEIYHGYLVYPVMASAARNDKVLIIGGGDGLALRDVLNWGAKEVTLVDLDQQLLDIFAEPDKYLPQDLARKITSLNKSSLTSDKVEVIGADAFLAIDDLIANRKIYDAILVDLPDPSHPDLNKLYSVNFYARLNQLLSADGVIGIQSTSPYHAKDSFIAIGNTLAAANFQNVEQYHDNVPSFGEWGWTIASKKGLSPLQRLERLSALPVEHTWLTMPIILSAFNFPNDFFLNKNEIGINYLGSHTIYQLHQKAWRDQQGISP